jgi:hypothetical protein
MDWRYLLLLLSPPHAHYLQASGIGIGIGIGHRIGGIGPQASGASGGRAVYLPYHPAIDRRAGAASAMSGIKNDPDAGFSFPGRRHSSYSEVYPGVKLLASRLSLISCPPSLLYSEVYRGVLLLSVDEFATELTDCLSVDEFASELTDCLSVM